MKDTRKTKTSAMTAAHLFKMIAATKLQGYQLLYTDGSKASGRVGIGVSGQELDLHQRLPDMVSIFSAEAAAIFMAITRSGSSRKAIITDSASVLKALESNRIRHPWVQAIRDVAKQDVVFVWVPSHCGIPGNEKADSLAALGRDSQFLTEQVPSSDIKTWVRGVVWNAWLVTWNQERCAFLGKIKGETAKWADVKNWRDQRVLSRLRTGYTRFTHDFGNSSDLRIWCENCSVQLTVEHVLSVCPLHHENRRIYGLEGSVRDILSNDPTREAALLCFLKDSGLYQQT